MLTLNKSLQLQVWYLYGFQKDCHFWFYLKIAKNSKNLLNFPQTILKTPQSSYAIKLLPIFLFPRHCFYFLFIDINKQQKYSKYLNIPQEFIVLFVLRIFFLFKNKDKDLVELVEANKLCKKIFFLYLIKKLRIWNVLDESCRAWWMFTYYSRVVW